MRKDFFWRMIAVVVLLIVSSTLMSMGRGGLPEGVAIQPSANPSNVTEFVRATNEAPEAARLFFTGDMLFVMSYLMLFAGIYHAIRQHQPVFAAFGLAFALMTGLFDFIENSIYMSYALQASNGELLQDPALLLLSALTTLKWVGVAGVYLAYSLAFPLETVVGKLAALTLLLVPIVILGSFAFDDLMVYRSLVSLIPLPVVLVYLWQQTGANAPESAMMTP